MADAKPASELPFIDNPMAPDIYADEAAGLHFTNGVVKITLASARANHATSPSPVNRVAIGRLVLTMPAAQALAVGLFNFLKNQGVDSSAVDSDGAARKAN
jgi:hypothetical protein